MTLTVPAWVRAAIANPHAAEWQATLIPTSGAPFRLPITAGSLTIDATRYPRSSVSLDLGDLSLAPSGQASPVLPFGAQLRIDYLLSDPAGRTVTLRPCPTLLVDEVEVGRGRSVGMSLTASDPSLAISTDVYAVPTTLPASARTVSTAIAYLIRRTFPAAVIDDRIGSTASTGVGFTVDGDPWAAIESLADTIGADVYVDTTDRFVVAPTPSIKAVATDTLRTGPGGTIVGTRSRVIRGYNRVLLSFRGDDGRVIVGRWADQSGGPLDVDSRYGRVTYTESRDRGATQTQADTAAARLARRTAGLVRDVEVEAVGAPWIETGDTVSVVIPTGEDRLVLSMVDHDLTGLGPSTYTFRTDTLGPA
jgi:hypothetical protein